MKKVNSGICALLFNFYFLLFPSAALSHNGCAFATRFLARDSDGRGLQFIEK